LESKVHIERQVRANRPDIIIKYKKEKTCIVVVVAIFSDRNVVQKGAEKNLNTRGYVGGEMNDYTCNNWSHWNSNSSFKEKFGSHTRETSNRFTTKTTIIGTSHIIRKVLQCET
jgi:hypothetical protein